MKTSEYWQKRFSELEELRHGEAAAGYQEISRQYQEAERELERQISVWYQRFAANNGISMQEARKFLSKAQREELQWDIEEYIRKGEENAITPIWKKQLENASAKAHISRLDALKLQIQQQTEKLFGNQLDSVDKTMRKVYEGDYYHTAFELQKGFSIGRSFSQLDEWSIQKVLERPWAPDGRNFSDRIWSNKQLLVNELNTTMTQNIILGKDPQKAIQAISRRLKVSQTAAGRLVMTESAAIGNAAQRDSFRELGVEQYEIVATLDSRTSEICRHMDGKHFKMSEWQTGVTAPPFHVNCRTATAPYFEEDFDQIGVRAAREEESGKTYYAPANMSYEEWKKAFVESGAYATPTTVGQSFAGYDQAQQDDLEQIYNNAPQEIKVLYAKYGGQLQPVDENVDPSIGEAYFSPSDGRVHMHKADAAAGNSYQEPFQVHFHEYAHNLDYLAGGGQNFSRAYKNAAQKTLEDVIMDDCEKTIKQYFKDSAADANGVYQKAFDAQLKIGGVGAEAYVRNLLHNYRLTTGMLRTDPIYQLLENELDAAKTEEAIRGFYTKHFDKFSKFIYDKSKVLDSFEDYIKMNHTMKEYSNLSDMFGRYSVQCGRSSYTFGFGHDPAYITGTGNLSAEGFAEMTDSTIASPGALALIKKYLPDAYNMYLKMLKRM
nr:MAG TPA: minor capsid protein [Caudoviricetes sp.]